MYMFDLFELSVSGLFCRGPRHEAPFDQSRAGKELVMSSFIARKLNKQQPQRTA
jgi:hypothetical protein